MTDIADQLYERLLVVRCQAGDEAGFEELVARYGPRLGYYVRKMLGKAGATDDVLQDVWFDVFRGLPKLVEPAAFSAWLYRIARDRTLRDLRDQRRTRPIEEVDLANIADEAGDDAEFSADDAQRIHAALDRLAPEHREVLVLRFVEDMSYELIAETTDCPLGTVRSRIYYAKLALRRAMERTVEP